jgi:hypothetical protein
MMISRSALYLMCLLVVSFSAQSQDMVLQPNRGEHVLAQVDALMASGDLEQAYQLANKHSDLAIKISLKLAQLALLLGHEQQAKAMFASLQQRSDVSLQQKKNMRVFTTQFERALEKKLKLARRWVQSGDCDKTNDVLLYLIQYESSQRQAKKYLKQCRAKEYSISLRIGGQVGVDSNVALSNEQLEENKPFIISGSYQDWNVLIKANAPKSPRGINGLSVAKEFSLIPSYYFSSREYDTQVSSYYDQINHKAQLEFKLKNWLGLDWRMPIYFRYSEYAGQHYNNSFGTKLSAAHYVDNRKHQVSLRWKKREYIDPLNQDHDSRLLDFGYQFGLNLKSIYLQGQINQQILTGPEAENDRYQSSSLALKFNYRLSLLGPAGFRYRTFATYSIKSRNYQGEELGRAREDLRQEYQVGLSLYNKNWRIKTDYSFQQRNSNVSVYDFQRSKFELGFYYGF